MSTLGTKVQTNAMDAIIADGHAPPLGLEVENIKNIWILFYRHGVNSGCYKGFHHSGDMRSAAARAKAHCAVMGYVYIYIRPFVVDIDAEEAWKLGKVAEGAAG